MSDEKPICKHPPCTCEVKKEGEYCSVSCEGYGGTVTIDCDCGHPQCTGDIV
jgi:hypothetical protein